MAGEAGAIHPLLQAIHRLGKKYEWADKAWRETEAYKSLFSSSTQVQHAVFMDAMRWRVPDDLVGGYCRAEIFNHMTISAMIENGVELDESGIIELLTTATHLAPDFACIGCIDAASRFIRKHGPSNAVMLALVLLQDAYLSSHANNRDKVAFAKASEKVIDKKKVMAIYLDAAEPWAKQALLDIKQSIDSHGPGVKPLWVAAMKATSSKPSSKWKKNAADLLQMVGDAQVRQLLSGWIALFGKPREHAPKNYPNSVWYVSENNAEGMRGVIWLASLCADKALVRAVAAAGVSAQKKIPMLGPRCSKVTNAAVWTLSQIDNPLAIGQLAILRAKIKNKSTQKQIEKAMQAVADRIGVSPEEMSVPTYGLTEVGHTFLQLGEFTAELHVTGTSSTEIRWIKPDGKPQKSVPKAVKDGFADELKDLKAAAKDIQKMLPAQRDRIDRLFLDKKTWAYETWAERYLEHPLVGILARRLIWVFDHGNDQPKIEAAWLDGKLVNAHGEPVEINQDSAIVSLWHPIGQDEDSVITWRHFFEERQIKQPFKQAHREVYILTDAERDTNIYSNRYATHVLRQHQFKSLAEQRGWRYALQGAFDSADEVAHKVLPQYEMKAEFWVDRPWGDNVDEWNEAGIFLRVVTDQVRFFPIDSAGRDTWHSAGNVADDAIPLDQIDPLVFSEVMRDVDLFVGVASVGNDPNWQDGGPEGRYHDYWHSYSFGDLGATAQTRRDILQRLVPRLKIADRCSFDDKFLIVRGDKRTYKIHLGSSNILMEPNDQYLCIVPGRGAGLGDKVFLPFEGDQRLAVILSKVMMLAEDTKIKDPTILSQIGR